MKVMRKMVKPVQMKGEINMVRLNIWVPVTLVMCLIYQPNTQKLLRTDCKLFLSCLIRPEFLLVDW